MGENGLLKNILSMGDSENCEVALVDMYRDLMYIGERLKAGIQAAIDKDVAAKARKLEEGAESSEEEEEEGEEEEEKEEEESGEETDADEKKNQKRKKTPKPMTDLEQLLQALDLHKQQKQHLLIKKAVLLKFEEALFGNNNITMTLDLRQLGDEEKDGKLEEILQCKDLTRYMPKEVTENGNTLEFAEKAALRECVSIAESPPDILKPFRPKTPKKIAVNLIKQQYNIRWNTKSGESRPFDFFDLPKQFRKGIVRKAHIQTVLYEHKPSIANLPSTLNSTGTLEKEDFCPAFVYVKKDPYAKDSSEGDESTAPVRARDEPKFSWQRWVVQSSDCSELGFEFPAELKWIHPKVKTLIKKLCHPIPDDFDPASTANLMYLLVLNDTTSDSLSDIGNTSQIYIGGADDGLKQKLLEGDECHCGKIKKLYEHFSSIEAFAPDTTALLVELRLLLALARREQYALFALQTFDDPRTLGRELHDLIIQALYLAQDEIWGPAVNMKFGLNVKEELKKRRKYLPDHFPGSGRKKKK
uniref:Uncharacterized protein LOC100182645 n=1 Tax=Phallusia mammillata TaxID=59560 RepID=A0A6F9DIF9_9ASCI|nr:uncharacterized protein LOC100182645 [Phallusia mammillata]